MRPIWFISFTVFLGLGVAAAENAKFCTQAEKELANSLHEQNTNPAKACYRAANGDITTLATSRLCPLPECVTWLDYMAANSPDCFFDSKNYATIYAAKSADCSGGASTSASGSANLHLSSRRSESSSSLANGTASSSNDSNNLSAMSEDRDLNTTSSLSASTAGEVPDVDQSSSMESASGDIEPDETNAPTLTPTEDLTIEGESASAATDSSNSTTPAPTTSASSSLPMGPSFIALASVVASVVIELV
ncbi:hypothetical protein V7S43_001000 [Phytophthora oleae]|uniref:Elicitin n=1 Tax=Phytophthora oleae TaxID=2107226 RepID=A0ABD3G3P4_9STRA